MNDTGAINNQQPAESRKKRRMPLWLLIVAAGIGLVAVCAGGVAYFFIDAASDVDDIEVVLEDFLKATSEDNLDRAYGFFSEEAQNATPRAAFKQGVPDQPSFHTFERLERGGWKKSFATGRPTIFQYTGTVWHEGGDRDDHYAEMVKEDAAWKIRYIEVQ